MLAQYDGAVRDEDLDAIADVQTEVPPQRRRYNDPSQRVQFANNARCLHLFTPFLVGRLAVFGHEGVRGGPGGSPDPPHGFRLNRPAVPVVAIAWSGRVTRPRPHRLSHLRRWRDLCYHVVGLPIGPHDLAEQVGEQSERLY